MIQLETASSNHSIGGCARPRVGLHTMEKREISFYARNQMLILQSSSLNTVLSELSQLLQHLTIVKETLEVN